MHPLSSIAGAASHGLLLEASITGGLTTLATSLVSELGLAGIFVLMMLDSACVPVPSEVTMLFAGFNVSTGRYGLFLVVAAGVLGNLVGAQITYAIGFYGRRSVVERYAHTLHLHPRQIARAEGWFERYGDVSVLIGRVLPLVRTFISLPAGFARMPFLRFSLLTVIGSVPWVLAWAVVGEVVGHNWSQWRDHLRYVDYVVVASLAVGFIVLTLRWLRRRRVRTAS